MEPFVEQKVEEMKDQKLVSKLVGFESSESSFDRGAFKSRRRIGCRYFLIIFS